jgi:hypothetical protein
MYGLSSSCCETFCHKLEKKLSPPTICTAYLALVVKHFATNWTAKKQSLVTICTAYLALVVKHFATNWTRNCHPWQYVRLIQLLLWKILPQIGQLRNSHSDNMYGLSSSCCGTFLPQIRLLDSYETVTLTICTAYLALVVEHFATNWTTN